MSQASYDTVMGGLSGVAYWWKLTETSGSTFASSGSGSINMVGTSISAAGTTGPDGVAKAVVHPGGAGKYLATASALGGLNAVTQRTFICWFKANSWTASGTRR
jgi:hypothetical protein